MCICVIQWQMHLDGLHILSLVMSQTTLGLVQELLGELQRSSDAELEPY